VKDLKHVFTEVGGLESENNSVKETIRNSNVDCQEVIEKGATDLVNTIEEYGNIA